MKIRQNKWVNLGVAITLSLIVFSSYFIEIFANSFFLNDRQLSYICVVFCFLLSLCFAKKDNTLLITLGLLFNCIADIFLVLNYSNQTMLAGVSVFLITQTFYALYTLTLCKSKTTKIINICARIIGSIIILLITLLALKIKLYEAFSGVYIFNFVITLIVCLCNFKSQYIMCVGLFLYICCDVCVGLTNGGASILGFSGSFIDFLYSFDMAFVFYIPGVYFISLNNFLKFSNKNHLDYRKQIVE